MQNQKPSQADNTIDEGASLKGGGNKDTSVFNKNIKPSRKNKRLRLLLLCNYDIKNASTVCDHINSFIKYSRHDVYVLSNLGNPPTDFPFKDFDIIVIHYSLTLAIEAYISPAMRNELRRFKGLKALFIQDEYRFVNRTIDAINYCGITLVFTCVSQENIPKVYPPELVPNVRFQNVLTGYIPNWLPIYPTIPLHKRKIMVGYRGRTYPAWHGRAGMEKIEIGARFLRDAQKYRLKCNIKWGEKDRIYGRHWVDFIRSCRAFLAVESGASVFDFSGQISSKTDTFTDLLEQDKVSRNPQRFLPELKSHYADMKDRYFEDQEDNIDLSQISPRVFEAAALRTMLIMYEGDYSGIFKAGRHYVALKKDHSNMAEVVAILKDPVKCAEIISNAYAEIIQNPDYAANKFIAEFDVIIKDSMKLGKANNRDKYEGIPKRPKLSQTVELSRKKFEELYPFYMVENPYGSEVSGQSKAKKAFRLGRAVLGRLRAKLSR